MEGERLPEMYLHRPQAKNPQHLCKVLCRQQGGNRMRGQRETQRAAPGQRPDSPEGTAGALFACCVECCSGPAQPGQSRTWSKRRICRSDRLWLLRWPQLWVGSHLSSSAQQLYLPMAMGKVPEVPCKVAAVSVRKKKFPDGSRYQKGLGVLYCVSLYHHPRSQTGGEGLCRR